jgi:hypothetical protein
MTRPSIRPISFDTWRRYPFSVRRWLVFVLEVAIGSIGVWLVRDTWWTFAVVGVVLSLDYLWTCWQVATAPPGSGATLGMDD